MLKKRYFKYSLEFIFILLIIMGGLKILESNKNSHFLEPDEAAWIFSGYYFNLYFLHFDIFNPDWNDYEAYDQPPLGKYIIGSVVLLKGYKIDSINPKRIWNSIPVDKFPIFFNLIKNEIPNPGVVIPFTRTIIFFFALSSVLLVYVSTRFLYGVTSAIISTFLIISNPIYHHYSIRILADPILLFFFILFFLFCGLYLKLQKNIYIIIMFILSALAFLTKLNGILLLFISMMVFLIKNRFSISKQNIKIIIAGFAAFMFLNILLNPVFVNDGIQATWRMVDARLSAFRHFREAYNETAFLSLGEKFTVSTNTMFFKSWLFYPLIKVPVELILFLSGIYSIFKKKDLFLLSVLVFMVIIPVSMLPFRHPRYFYWVIPFIAIISSLSINSFKDILNKANSYLKNARIKILKRKKPIEEHQLLGLFYGAFI